MAANYRRRAGCNSREARLRSSIAANAGDDLLLIFKVKSKNSRGEILSENDFRVSDSDYIAVYDKKMLWRANLYIAKPEEELGDIDWNTAHSWTGEEGYGANEWNIPEAGYTGQAGGQIVSLPSTKWHYGSKNADRIIRKAVSYDHQGWDDPFSYKEKIKEQKELLNQWYTSDGKKFSKPIYKWPANTTLFWRFRLYGGKTINMLDFKNERKSGRFLYKPA
jgi:hypothetical protein